MSKSIYLSFETERLFLKPMSKEDAPFLLELFNSPKWIKYIGDRNVRTVEEAATYIKLKMTPQLKKLGYSNYTVVRKIDHVKLGSCGLYDREGLEGVDLGFAFLPQYEKMGYAFESASKIKEVAFNNFNLKKLSAITTEENIDSQRLLEKLGFEYIKIINIPDDDEDLLFFEIKYESISSLLKKNIE